MQPNKQEISKWQRVKKFPTSHLIMVLLQLTTHCVVWPSSGDIPPLGFLDSQIPRYELFYHNQLSV